MTTLIEIKPSKPRKFSVPKERIDQVCPALIEFVVAVGSMRSAQRRSTECWSAAVGVSGPAEVRAALLIAEASQRVTDALQVQVDNMVNSLLGRDLAEIEIPVGEA